MAGERFECDRHPYSFRSHHSTSGCSLSWFLYDVCYYGVFLLVPDILRDIYGGWILPGLPPSLIPTSASQPANLRPTLHAATSRPLSPTPLHHPATSGEVTLATGCWLGLLTTACGLPGILLTMCIVRGDMMRMKRIQTLSFAIIAVSAGVLGGIYAPLVG